MIKRGRAVPDATQEHQHYEELVAMVRASYFGRFSIVCLELSPSDLGASWLGSYLLAANPHRTAGVIGASPSSANEIKLAVSRFQPLSRQFLSKTPLKDLVQDEDTREMGTENCSKVK